MSAILRLTALVAFAAPLLSSATPVWTPHVESSSDEVRLANLQGGILRIDYSLALEKPRLSGCTRYTGGFVEIRLAEPLALGDEARHLVFELKASATPGGVVGYLNPIIVDEDGERFVYAYRNAPQLDGVAGAWARRTTPDFYAGEAGAASQDVFELDGSVVDGLPGGDLKLIGFRLSLRRESGSVPRATGTFWLGDFAAVGERFGFEPPFVYADAIFPRGGEFRLVRQVLDRFQALPRVETEDTFRFDPACADYEALRKAKIEFPVGADGIYRFRATVLDAQDVVRTDRTWSRQIFGSDRAPFSTRVASSERPKAGVLLVNPDDAACGVRERGDISPIELRLFPKAGEELSVSWHVMPCVCTNVLYSGSGSVAGDSVAVYQTLLVPVRALPGRDAYRLKVDVSRGGEAIARETYFFGFKSDPAARHSRAGARTSRRALKSRPYNRTTFLPLGGEDNVYTEERILADVEEFLTRTENMSRHFTYMVDLKDFEVLPGVRDTYLLDRVLDLAADHGCGVTIRAAHCDLYGRNEYRWNSYSRQIASDGTVAAGHAYYGAYAVTDSRTVDFWLGFYRAIFDRYDGHTAFEGYYVMQPGGEWTVVDQPWDGTFTGYDQATEASFKAWCAAEGLPVPEAAPRPDFRGGATPDLRPEWIAFCRFKRLLGAEWMKTSVNAIRAFDDDRIVMSYCEPDEVARLLGDRLDYAHNGGNHYGDHLGDYIDAWNSHRVGWITEPHHPHCWAAHGDPAQAGWPLHWSMWVMTAQAAGGGANLHVYYNPWGPDKLSAYGGVQAYDLFQSVEPMLDELHDMTLVESPRDAAFLSDEATLFAKHRTTFHARLADLRRWRELAQDDSVPLVDYRADEAAGYRLVLPNILDEVMFPETFDALVAAVTNGATTVITPRTGMRVADGQVSGEPYRLLSAFGIPAPKAEYCRRGLDVRATVVAAHSCFAKGREIVFETSERQHAQLLDPKIQADFWRYRWRFIPETDYFGFFEGVEIDGRDDGAEVIARFADGGAAVSRHRFGKGEVIVFWGTPEINDGNLRGFIGSLAEAKGVRNPQKNCPVPHTLEGFNRRLGRHYLLTYKVEPGAATLKAPAVADGEYFVDDMVSGQRLGRYTGAELREKGIALVWHVGYSPLKYIRMIPVSAAGFDRVADWSRKFRQ